MNSTIFVRVFLETTEVEVAENTAMSIVTKLQSIGELSQKQVKQYWKIPEYFEICLEIIPKINLEEAFQETMNQLGDGWEFINLLGEKWAIWNSSEIRELFIPKVRWANVEIIS